MQKALRLFDQLEITYLPPTRQAKAARETHCGPMVEKLIAEHGMGHVTFVLRVITESAGNDRELTEDVIKAVSRVVLAHWRWANRGLAFIEAFDQIKLADVRKTAKSSEVRPLYSAIAALLYVRLVDILGPPKPVEQKPERIPPKPPRSVTRIPEVEKNITLGLELIALRTTVHGNVAFGRAARARFDIDSAFATECMRVARAYGTRPEVFRRLSWDALVALSSPSMPAPTRRRLELKVDCGGRLGAPEIRRAHSRLPNGRPRQKSNQQPAAMAA